MKKLLIGILALVSVSSFAQHRRVIYNSGTANDLVKDIGSIAKKAMSTLSEGNDIKGCYYVGQLAFVTSNISIVNEFKVSSQFKQEIDALNKEMESWIDEDGLCAKRNDNISPQNISTWINSQAHSFLEENPYRFKF